MTQKDIDLLESEGWEVVCESPFEIEYIEDRTSHASGLAAQMILTYLKI